MNTEYDVLDQAPASVHDYDRDAENERKKGYGKEIFRIFGNTVTKNSDGRKRRTKLSPEDRDRLARSLGRQLKQLKLDRSRLAFTKECMKHGIDHQELYRLILEPDETNVRRDRLRAAPRKYLAVISGIAELRNMDPYLLAHRVTNATSIHPSNLSKNDGLQKIVDGLYDAADIADEKHDLSERFAILASRKLLLSQDDPYACWPNGTCFRPEPDCKDPFQFNYWRIREGESAFEDTLLAENTSLLQFLRYVPHLLIGIRDGFDDVWRIKKSDQTQTARPSGRGPLILLSPSLCTHAEALRLKADNRNRLHDLFGASYTPKLAWDRQKGILMVNDLSEQDYIEKGKQHMMAYLKDVGLNPDWTIDQNELFHEHSVWLCLYPSWHSIDDGENSMVPVIVQNYAWGGASSEIMIDDVETYLSDRLHERFLGGFSALERLEEILGLSDTGGEPAILAEFSRTADFIEEHPLMKRYRKLEKGLSYIREGIDREA